MSATNLLAVVNNEATRVELEAAVAALGNQIELTIERDVDVAMATLRHLPADMLIIEIPSDTRLLASWARQFQIEGVACPIVGILDDQSEEDHSLLVEAVRAGAVDFLRRPCSAGELGGILKRISRPSTADKRRGKLLAFMSTKGGVGKSTLAVNTALSIAQRTPDRVLLIDASLQLGVASSLLNILPEVTLRDIAEVVDRLDTTLLREMATVHESGLHLLPAPLTPTDAADIDDRVMSVILGVAKRTYDYVVVDTFPLIDRIMLCILDRTDHTVVVTENVVPTLTGTVALLRILDSLGIDSQRRSIVLNRFQRAAGSLSVVDVSEQLGTELRGVIPQDSRVVEAANLGAPIINRRSWWGAGREIRRTAEAVFNQLERAQAGTHSANSMDSDRSAEMSDSKASRSLASLTEERRV